MAILRYPVDVVVTSTQNGFSDVLDWLGFLSASDYLRDILVKVHGLTAPEAKRRASEIIPHVRIASGYIQQSLEGPRDLAFLPAYYSILNLSKIYVLLGPRHADLPKHRTHGVSYNANRKDSQTVLTEVIALHRSGVFPLFYETLTGRPMKPGRCELQLKAVLPCIVGTGFEYALATGKAVQMCALQFGIVGNRLTATATAFHEIPDVPPTQPPNARIQCLQGFEPVPGFVPQALQLGQFSGEVVANPVDFSAEIRRQVRTYLFLRRHDQDSSWTLFGTRKIEFPEEIPIWLLFFYMSSIVRYKPEFFSRLKDSKYWPQLSAARLHAFLDFLLAFWSFVHRRNYFLVAP
jgi:hypothetical protein